MRADEGIGVAPPPLQNQAEDLELPGLSRRRWPASGGRARLGQRRRDPGGVAAGLPGAGDGEMGEREVRVRLHGARQSRLHARLGGEIAVDPLHVGVPRRGRIRGQAVAVAILEHPFPLMLPPDPHDPGPGCLRQPRNGRAAAGPPAKFSRGVH